jgi:hypothetical protein
VKKIKGTAYVVSEDRDDFFIELNDWILKFQDNGLDVEIQSNPATSGHRVCHTALIIAREK